MAISAVVQSIALGNDRTKAVTSPFVSRANLKPSLRDDQSFNQSVTSRLLFSIATGRRSGSHNYDCNLKWTIPLKRLSVCRQSASTLRHSGLRTARQKIRLADVPSQS